MDIMNTFKIENICVFCGRSHFVDVPQKEWLRYVETNEKIQVALPMLTPTEREQIISSICPTCQKKIF